MFSEGKFPKIDGDRLYASEINNIRSRVLLLYEGTDLDVNNTSANKEFDTITPTSDKIKINISGKMYCFNYNEPAFRTANLNLKVEAKDVGGAYSTIFDKSIMSSICDEAATRNTSNYMMILHELSEDMINNGVVYKLTFTGTGNDGAGQFTNWQIWFESV